MNEQYPARDQQKEDSFNNAIKKQKKDAEKAYDKFSEGIEHAKGVEKISNVIDTQVKMMNPEIGVAYDKFKEEFDKIKKIYPMLLPREDPVTHQSFSPDNGALAIVGEYLTNLHAALNSVDAKIVSEETAIDLLKALPGNMRRSLNTELGLKTDFLKVGAGKMKKILGKYYLPASTEHGFGLTKQDKMRRAEVVKQYFPDGEFSSPIEQASAPLTFGPVGLKFDQSKFNGLSTQGSNDATAGVEYTNGNLTANLTGNKKDLPLKDKKPGEGPEITVQGNIGFKF